jgi:hypothetical protein
MKPHKHAELIKAWADGAEIQVRISSSSEWQDSENPYWTKHYEYRIKPEPKPDIVVSRWVYRDGSTVHCSKSNVKYIFDGETGQLKSAEVLT